MSAAAGWEEEEQAQADKTGGEAHKEEQLTMLLTEEERNRALEIKAAVEADDRIRNLSDFEYVHYALTRKSPEETMESLTHRVYMMQCFREEYRIQDTFEEGLELIHQYTQQQPGLVIDVQLLASSYNYLSVEDFAKFNPRAVKTHEDYRIFTGGSFYMLQARQPNFAAIREGMPSMVECEGASFANFDSHVTERYQHEFFLHYPYKMKEVFLLNSPTVVNVFFALIKRFLSEETAKAFHLGHQVEGLEGQRIDTFYNTPTRNMIRKVLEALQIRYKNQEEFSLAQCTGGEGLDGWWVDQLAEDSEHY
ncbi:expressed unknown protein [Seminavis robusta]|uniref:CRAL-TRIO domain-containing protein n=1 Tax=Seminavis robusta TaxID=568900 RepID=A0A9N8EAQ5_9STRA|nr:expressed unknown protein [Seminavis robusta]|eukprot:Sro735_g194890.1 n/a (308) ;mRNA; f:28218-29141